MRKRDAKVLRVAVHVGLSESTLRRMAARRLGCPAGAVTAEHVVRACEQWLEGQNAGGGGEDLGGGVEDLGGGVRDELPS